MKNVKFSSLPLQLELFARDVLPAALLAPGISQDAISPPGTKPDVPLPEKRAIELNDTRIEYEFRRSGRRTIGFLVNENGLRVTAPKRATFKLIEQAIREKAHWITKKLHYFLCHHEKHPPASLQLQEGALLPYLGRRLTLRLRSHGADAVIMNPFTDELLVPSANAADARSLENALRKWFQERARQVFAERLPVYAKQLGISYRSFSLSSAMRRWGSCSVSGNIRLNWRLVYFPLALIDYVVAHELAHLHEMNHGKRFWDIVSTVYPDYKIARKQLNEKNMQIPSLL